MTLQHSRARGRGSSRGAGAWAALALAGMAAAGAARAADWPEWRGPKNNGVTVESGWQTQWPPSGPRRVWTAQVGEGYSSVTAMGGRVYTMGSFGNRDTVVCLDTASGRPVWSYPFSRPARNYGADPVPNGTASTPVVDGGSIHVLSREGLAICLNAATGKPVWQRDVARETGAQTPQWGFAGSPLVHGNLVVYNVGTSGIALEKSSGRVAWKSGGGRAGYATPVPYKIRNQSGLAIFSGNALYGVEPASGRVLWQFPWQTSYDVNAADPIVSGETMFISSGYNKGCALLNLASGRPTPVWQNRNMRNQFNSSVLVNGHIYGNDQNTLKCLELATGNERWQQRGLGQGGLIAIGDKLLVLTERGELSVMQATPDRPTTLTRAKVLDGNCWTHPVLSNGLIYCRNREGTLIALDARGK